MISFDARDAEGNYSQMPSTEATPEFLYERQWALALVHHTLEQLRIEMRAEGKEVLFGHFDAILAADPKNFSYSKRAASLGLTIGALRVALYRWRQRFQVLIREEIARTVASKFEIENELRHLHLILARTE